jgi:hypothetical protein
VISEKWGSLPSSSARKAIREIPTQVFTQGMHNYYIRGVDIHNQGKVELLRKPVTQIH